jgi:hypothetical protein
VIDGTLEIRTSPVASGIIEVSEGAFTVANCTQVSTGGGDVWLKADESLTVKSEVNTLPGSGGKLEMDSKVHLESRIVVGKSNVTMIVG